MIIYPENRTGFDKIFARIHINNTNPKAIEGQNFFSAYQIKSQKEKCAILISPHDLTGFIQDLKILEELGYDAMFKLTQCNTDDQVQKFIEITGSSGPGSSLLVLPFSLRGGGARSIISCAVFFLRTL